ncbi:MAG: transporter substrate-binding domain-containing protein, partial [Streptomycetales bacterium]
IQQGKVDFVAATYTIDEERDKVVDFAGPYYVAGQQIMVEKGNSLGINGPDGLAGHKVCTVTGSTPEQNIRENYPEAAKQLVLFDEYSKCADALQNGQVDAVTTDNVILSGFVFQSPDEFEIVGKTFTEEPYGIGVQQGDTEFCEFVNETLNKLYENGQWAKAYDSSIGKVAGKAPEPPATGSCTTPGAE